MIGTLITAAGKLENLADRIDRPPVKVNSGVSRATASASMPLMWEPAALAVMLYPPT